MIRFFYVLRLGLLGALGAFYSVDAALIWTTSGGGWRSMVTAMGFANIFYKAGLISNNSSEFLGISSNSGASWFTGQLFFSPQFFSRTMVNDTQALYDFVVQWMDSYKSLFDTAQDNAVKGCNGFVLPSNYLQVPKMFACMIETASKDYGDPDFVKRTANSDNRVPAFQSTNLYLQGTLYPTMRKVKSLWIDGLTYLGPYNSNRVYAVPLAVQYGIQENSSIFHYAVLDEELPFRVYKRNNYARFNYEHWEDFYMYPGTNGNVYAKNMPRYQGKGLLREPFKGQLNVLQAMLFGSISYSQFSSLSPSAFAQKQSVLRYDIIQKYGNFREFWHLLYLDFLTQRHHHLIAKITDFAICSQWPNDCDLNDALLGDGGVTDGTSLALHIGQYHTDGGDLGETLKVIVTLTYYTADLDTRFLGYFSTPYNQGVTPGDFFWPPSIDLGVTAHTNPTRSMQIFSNFLDVDSFASLRVGNYFNGLEGNASAVRLNLTTVDNPPYGVRAGQNVDMLILTYKQNITTVILGRNQVDNNKYRLAQIPKEISGSAEILQTVEEFIAS